MLEKDIFALKDMFPFVEIGVAGKSVMRKSLYYLKLGRGEHKVFYNATHHASEWLNAPMLMEFAKQFAQAYADNTQLAGANVLKLWKYSSIYIIPMVNPDGVDLVFDEQRENAFWNANIRGVDLNRNYPANWLKGKAQEQELGIEGPGPTRFGGEYELSEPETKALVKFTRQYDFQLVLAYHSQGREIYWQYLDLAPENAKAIGEKLAEVSGYKLDINPAEASFAGYKDWFIEEFGRPGFTVETGLGENPLPSEQLQEILNENMPILLMAADANLLNVTNEANEASKADEAIEVNEANEANEVNEVNEVNEASLS